MIPLLKRLIKEDPDAISYKGNVYKWRDKGMSSFMIYPDNILKRGVFVAVNYNDRNWTGQWADNKEVNNELEFTFNFKKPAFSINDPMVKEFMARKRWDSDEKLTDEQLFAYINNSRYELLQNGVWNYTHGNILSIINRVLNRTSVDDRDETGVELSGRVFNVNGVYLITFWDERDKIKPYKNHIVQYLNGIGIDYKTALYQTYDMDDSEDDDNDSESEGNSSSAFLSFNEIFGTSSRQMSDTEKTKKELANQLHIKKGQLDKAILDVLASKPKNVNDLYAGLEKQLGMPIAKIRHVFNGIPLDKLVVKEVREHFKKH
jgi:hypothetical protein